MTRTSRIVIRRPPDPLQPQIDAMRAALARRKETPPQDNVEQKRSSMIRSLRRVLSMLKGEVNG